MWFSFWRSRNRFSLDELRYLTDQLSKFQIINDVNKDFVIEALRSIAELITYGDQHDPSFFEFFMEKQVMGEFVRILKISRTFSVSLQLLQTMSIMIQNLKSEHAMYYMFSNEHINYLITYSFNFDNEELLSYYISFLRAISGKLNKSIISLLVKTEDDEVVSFPLYTEAIRFAFHEESMVRTAIRALTLNVYHVGDDSVNRFVVALPQAQYFTDLVKFFQKQYIGLNDLVSNALKASNPDSVAAILSAVDEIEDTLYYFSDITSAGIPDVGRLLTKDILKHLVLTLLFPSLKTETSNETQIGSTTSLYLLCCILQIVKIKDLANTIVAGLFVPSDAFVPKCEDKVNGVLAGDSFTRESLQHGGENISVKSADDLDVLVPSSSSIEQKELQRICFRNDVGGSLLLRETLLSYVRNGNNVQAMGSLILLAMLLQTKELDESMLDALGILPQRKKHKKLLLEALVGEGSGEEQLFSSGSNSMYDGMNSELDIYLQKLKDQYGVAVLHFEDEPSPSPRIHRSEVLDSLFTLFCRSSIAAEIKWEGGWLLRQLLPHGEVDFSSHHLVLLNDAYKNCSHDLVQETRGRWTDLLISILNDEWRKCKRVIEASSPRKEPKSTLLSLWRFPEDAIANESSLASDERMCEVVKVFVLLRQLKEFSAGRALPEEPLIVPVTDIPENARAKTAGLDAIGPKPGTELRLVDGLPCRIAFERGKERRFYFLALSFGISGWVILAEELPLKRPSGIVRVAAPLAGANPRIDDKHLKWLHLCIRPSSLPLSDASRSSVCVKGRARALVDGRWTLAFRDEESCKSALSMILEESNHQSNEVARRLKHLLSFENT